MGPGRIDLPDLRAAAARQGFPAQARIVSSRNCALAPIATAPALGGLNAPQGYQMQRNLSERLWVCHDR
jgi:hypothetical protein